ncbi:protein adenylyltransferase SelO [Amniculibacterium sp. G2-70]|uniref:protein adenylyltransferase SelO n=1 Tax=Amniculibacterium sp. G2-70 TaxID=2767188 RepID=UPI00165495A6|nr:YdiU family protein [Amniculibacterium sp. G2-70]
MHLEKITQRYLDLFPTDRSKNTMQRTVPNILSCLVDPVKFDLPKLLYFNEQLSEELGLGKIENHKDEDFLAAQNLPKNIRPFATAYAGHQFGQWAGQLGDGRAIYAGEILQKNGKFQELQWKGAGATPFSRAGDGRAVLRSTIREFLMSEALHHLKIPTTRGLSISLTGEQVIRDVLYNGNPKPEPGAVMLRTAESFLRFGHFEWFSAQRDYETLEKLGLFCIENYYPEINLNDDNKYKKFFEQILERTANLMVDWLRVGFVHGVMNTDNLSIIGLTIDYGPFSMLDEYDTSFTPNTTDLPGRRYAFGEQGKIAQWNLWKLANALFPLIEDADYLTEKLEYFNDYFNQKSDEMLCKKFGFENMKEDYAAFFEEWQLLMEDLVLDYTLFFTALEKWKPEFEVKSHFQTCFYKNNSPEEFQKLSTFLKIYDEHISNQNFSEENRLKLMQENNPKFVLRNYLLYECIEEVSQGKMEFFNALFLALQTPYDCDDVSLTKKRPSKYDNQSGCSMLSCSS